MTNAGAKPPVAPRRIELGPYAPRGERTRPSATEIAAVALTVAWLALVAVFFLILDQGEAGFDALRFIVVLLAVFLPVAMVWLWAAVTRTGRLMQTEADRLHAAIDALRRDYLAQVKTGAAAVPDEVGAKLEQLAEAQKKTEGTLAKFISIRPAARPAPVAASAAPASGDGAQPDLGLAPPAEAAGPPLSMANFIAAIQFPADPDDKEGFRALRRALQDRRAAQLVTAAQDVLTLLSQDGIYMDDLRPERARTDTWRKFAHGERGRTVADIGGVRDRSSLALSSARMRSDTVFRDAAHHFLRLFDQIFAEIEPSMTDPEIAALADTRTARAFMLLGRVTGIFD
ncbi:hypothetical protein DXV76_17285 [Rhodobacteraceae bacterium CCMM004]|nr:hypothetical protein DXV76_17285 [Rhodobacteraceae bacterium CCMM004]